MLPKRKIIRKRHLRAQQQQAIQNTTPFSLLEKLRSVQDSDCQEALAFISSMCHFQEETVKELVLISQMMAILKRNNRNLVHSCLFSLANLCQIAPRLVPRLFQLGLDKALIQLNSNQKQLLKPIMCLMIALHDHLPEAYRFLQDGVQSSLQPSHLSSPAKGLVLQFLVRLERGAPKSIRQTLYSMFKNQQSLKIRSLCLQILLQQSQSRESLIKDVWQYCQQLFNDINLEQEYNNNIVQTKAISSKTKETQAEAMQDQVEEVLPQNNANYQTFIDAVQAVELLCETLLDLVEQNWQEEQEDQDIQVQVQSDDPLAKSVCQFISSNLKNISKNCYLSFPEGQNINAFSLRLLAHSGFHGSQLSNLVVTSIRKAGQGTAPQEVLIDILTIGLHLLLKCPIAQQDRQLLIMIGEKGLKINEEYKEGWIRLLQLFSMHFNPQKNAVSREQNYRIGTLLKTLIINIPRLELEQWRSQTLDTLFDIYSNEQFDDIFVSLGFMQLLKTVAQRGSGAKKTKFIREVLSDVNRFMEYKRKMIKF